jgi:hypothetical protein
MQASIPTVGEIEAQGISATFNLGHHNLMSLIQGVSINL